MIYTIKEETVKELSSKLNEPKWLLDLRLKALNEFNKIPTPNLKYSMSVLTDTNRINFEDINTLNQISDTVKVENKDVIVLPFEEALKNNEYSELIKKYFMTSIKNNKFTLLHKTSFGRGIFVYIPKNVEVNDSIHINLNVDTNTQLDTIFLVAEENSKANIIQTKNNENKSFYSEIVEVFTKNNSKINFSTIQNLNEESINLVTRKSNVDKDSNFDWLDCYLGSSFTLADVTSILNGEGASSNNYSLFFGANQQNFDLCFNTIHNAPNTNSDMISKGVLNDKAKTICRGLIRIESNASGSNGFQKEDILLLSKDAEVDPIPNLEINNHDVKCSHGATVSQINDENLFYLKSRGIEEKESRKLIVNGFFEHFITKIENENLRNELKKLIGAKLAW
ncbi:MAG: Fe-S cluster assembly protein SufD [Candidatus Nanoarchaeia archaeon]|jgi:Fe-S cluster assembly protein SufD|nr:Fe-S cluster assembly protein SufD [Candidatus Nanoarchaeia archaeon]|tara:strand:+ start:15634 stop:16818 length:1185 start_codon:yes stop_codon:yes gene_type:complete